MARDFDPGALLGRSYPLAEGLRVTLRMAHSSDARAIRRLLARRSGGEAGPIELARLVRFDPRRQLVLCATALIDGGERLVGVGSIALERNGAEPPQPELVAVDPEVAPSVASLLAGALIGRVQALSRDRAA